MECAFGFRQVPDTVSELLGSWLSRFKTQELKLIVVAWGGVHFVDDLEMPG